MRSDTFLHPGDMLRHFLLLVLALLSCDTHSQEGATLQGVVLDGTTNEPVIFAAVYLKERSYGAYTDLEGRFTIKGVPPALYTIVVELVGYERLIMEGVALRPGEQRIDVRLRPMELIGGPPVLVEKRIPWPRRWFMRWVR